MKILITGASGFVAAYLAEEIARNTDWELSLTAQADSSLSVLGRSHPIRACDLACEDSIRGLVRDVEPDLVAHLGAISHPLQVAKDLKFARAVNVLATDAFASELAGLAESRGRPVSFLYASTALVYGGLSGRRSVDEETGAMPEQAYGCSKLAAEALALMHRSERFIPWIVRPFNHIGPGQAEDFVCAGFAAKIARARDGERIEVGNLEAERDFTDVRDMVRAYRLILESGVRGHVKGREESSGLRPSLFVAGSGRLVRIGEVLEALIRISGKNLKVQVAQDLLRGGDRATLYADARRLKEFTGWQTQISLEDSLCDIYRAAEAKHSGSLPTKS